MTPADRKAIESEYAWREREAGGIAKADAQRIVQDIARERGLPVRDVISALLDAWAEVGV